MVELHGVAPDEFLDFVHDIDLSALSSNLRLIAGLTALPGKRVVFTNASRGHALAALAAIGLSDLFDVVASIEDSGYVGKPHRSAFETLFRQARDRSNGVRDVRRSRGELLGPRELGMKTALVVDPFLHVDRLNGVQEPDHVDVVVTNRAVFLDESAIQA